MSESNPRRKLAAILAANVVNFSILMGENEDRALKNLKACRTLADDCIEVTTKSQNQRRLQKDLCTELFTGRHLNRRPC